MNPERMVIAEARRAYTYLQLYGYGVDGVIVNRIIPEDEAGTVMAKYVEAQAGYLKEIEHSFSPLPIFRVPHVGQEVFGLDLLREIGAGLYPERDPAEVFHAEQAYRMEADGDAYLLSVHLPFLNEDEVTAEQFGDELVVQVRNQRRSYGLPNFLSYYRLATAALEDGWLRARFEPNPAESS